MGTSIGEIRSDTHNVVYFWDRGSIILNNPRKEKSPGCGIRLCLAESVILMPIVLVHSFSCSAVVLVLVSQPNSSNQQSDLAGRQLGPKKARPCGSNRPRRTRESTESTINI